MKPITSTLLLTLLLLLNLSAQQPLPCTQVSVQDLNGQQPYITGACLELSSDLHVAAKNVKMEADQRIHFAPGSKISPNQNGHFQASIRDNALDVVWMEPGISGVAEQYKKMELGIRLSSEIEAQINDFLEENQSDVAPRQNPNSLNPFDPDEISVWAEFTSLQGPAWMQNNSHIQYGFFYKDFLRIVDPVDESNSYWQEVPSDYRFRIRFAPRKVGLWKCKVKALVNLSDYYELAEFEFNVVSSNGHDFVKVGDSKRYLTIENETFFPTGMNLTHPECYFDLNNNFDPAGCSVKPNDVNGWYNRYGAGPEVYEVFHRELEAFSDAGANYFRMDILPWFSEIEFEKIANYNDRLNRAWELDKIVEYAAYRDLYIHFNTQIQYPLDIVGNYGFRYWDWSAYNEYGANVPPECWLDPQDLGYCYNTDLNLTSCSEFYSDPLARHYYKNRLRYYIARYGYSTNIAVFETNNESSGMCSSVEYEAVYNAQLDIYECKVVDGSANRPYYDGPYAAVFQSNLEEWQDYMLFYMDHFMGGNQHILSVNYLTGGPGDYDNTFDSQYLDIVTIQNYSSFPDHTKTGSMDNAAEVHQNQDLPFTHGETSSGLDYCTCDNDASWIRDLWLGAFTGICTGPLLWDNQHRQDLWIHFGRLRNFTQGIDFNDSGDNNHDGWTSEHDERSDHRAEMFCLRNWENGHKRAIGVIGNNTYNYYTQAEGLPCSDSITKPLYPYNTPSDVGPIEDFSIQNTLISIPNMGTAVRYNIEYYNVMTGQFITQYMIRSDYNGELFLPYPEITANDTRPIVLFKIYKMKDGSFDRSKISGDSVVNAGYEEIQFRSDLNGFEATPDFSDDFKIYPNPASEILNVEYSGQQSENIVSIYSFTGQLLLQSSMVGNKLQIKTSQWTQGVYIIVFQNMEGNYHAKFVKN